MLWLTVVLSNTVLLDQQYRERQNESCEHHRQMSERPDVVRVHCCSCTSTPSRTVATCIAFMMWALMARMTMMGPYTAGAILLCLP
jgi:predicted metal-binding membrane protein